MTCSLKIPKINYILILTRFLLPSRIKHRHRNTNYGARIINQSASNTI